MRRDSNVSPFPSQFRGKKRYGTGELASASLSTGRTGGEEPPRRGIIWLASIAVILPFTFGETGKYVIALLFFPALYHLITSVSRGKRQVMACDFFMWGAALWMIAVKFGSPELFASVSDAFALVGSYMVARSFLFAKPSLKHFVRTVKILVVILVALCILDTLTGTFFTRDLIEKVFPNPRPVRPDAVEIHRSLFGVAVLRAASIFEHPILFGTYCAAAATMFLSVERGVGGRVFYCGVCLLGVFLSISSAPLLGCVIVFSGFAYDRLLRPYPQRWKIFYVIAMLGVGVLFVVSDNPLTWLLRHATLDPADGYYRIMIWQNAFEYIGHSPFLGADPISWSQDEILGNSIDCVWLVLGLEYGLPVVALLVLSSVSACGVFGRKIDLRLVDDETLQMRTGFSLLVFLFAFVGLAVHFWGSVWMLWGLSIGIRTSIEEYCLAGGLSTRAHQIPGRRLPRQLGRPIPHAIGSSGSNPKNA